MKKLLTTTLILLTVIACEENCPCNKTSQTYLAEVIGYNTECSTCLLQFPNDSIETAALLGESNSFTYNAVNLKKDEFEIGQLLNVRFRLAKEDEFNACYTQDSTLEHIPIYMTHYVKFNGSKFNTEIAIKLNECKTVFGESEVCFKNIVEDNRCPKGAECVQAGWATVQISISTDNSDEQAIELRTDNNPVTGTNTNNFNICLNSLWPYPDLEENCDKEKFMIKITIADLNKLEANAQVTAFNPDKNTDTYGWTIKTKNETLLFKEPIIGETIGYTMDEPIDVYIEYQPHNTQSGQQPYLQRFIIPN